MSGDTKVKDISKIISDMALAACRKQIITFSQALKKKLLESGVEKAMAEEIILEAFKGYKTMATFTNHCQENLEEVLEAFVQPTNRGRDPLGRVLTEQCIVRARKKSPLFPASSTQDVAARKRFVRGVIVRPLLSYFLVSVRGTIQGVDNFEARSMLFGPANPEMEERAKTISSLVDEYTITYNFGKKATKWSDLYDDPRSKEFALELVNDVLENMTTLGPDRYLKIIQNIQNMDKSKSKSTTMERQFNINDVKQLIACLKAGKTILDQEFTPPDEDLELVD